MPLVLSVVSKVRESGKTSLIEELVKRFTEEGFRVATVKHIDGSFDTARKDTWRHIEAGAALTVATTPTEVVTIMRSADASLEKALEVIYIDPDLVLVEGYRMSSNPKILCTDTASEAQAALEEISNIVMISGPIATKDEERERLRESLPEVRVYGLEELVLAVKERMVEEILEDLPGLDCGRCGYEHCAELAKAILSGEARIEDCDVIAKDIATLKVDSKTIPISAFPQQIIRGVMLGILGSLKGVGKHPREIEMKIKA